MIDLHAHILPGLDDGPPSLEGSLALARAAVAMGTTTLVATPHIDWSWKVEPKLVNEAVASLSRELERAQIPLELRTGGEIAVSRLDDLGAEELSAVSLGGGPYLLLECPHVPGETGLEAAVFGLRTRGHHVVLAHPERCPAIHHDFDLLRRLVDNEALTSVSAGSLTGRFGRTVRNVAFELVRAGLVHNVSSDCHDDTRRPPSIRAEIDAAEQRLAELSGQAEWLTQEVPSAVLSGTPLTPRPVIARSDSTRSRLRRKLMRRPSSEHRS